MDFLHRSDADILKEMKKHVENLSDDFQHCELISIEQHFTKNNIPHAIVWEKVVNSATWPQFTDYLHQKTLYKFENKEWDVVEVLR